MNAAIIELDKATFLNQLREIGNQIDGSINNPKAFALNLHRFTSYLSASPYGMRINENIAQKNSIEETALHEELRQLFQLLDTSREEIRRYIKDNHISLADDISSGLTHGYDMWRNHCSKETLILCQLLRDAIIALVLIIEDDKRPHLDFARKFGIIRDDGTIESLKFFEDHEHFFEKTFRPFLKKHAYRLSGKWDRIVEFHNSENPEQCIEEVGIHVLHSHARAITDYTNTILSQEKPPHTNETPNLIVATPTIAIAYGSEAVQTRDAIAESSCIKFNHKSEELTIGNRVISFNEKDKKRGEIEQTIIKQLFNKKGNPKRDGISMKEIHDALGRETVEFTKEYKDSINSGFIRINNYIKDKIGSNTEKLIVRDNNILFINSKYSPKQEQKATKK